MSLRCLTSSFFVSSRSDQAQQKKLLQISLAHALIQASGKQSFISPLLLSVGLFVHQTTRSRVLIDVLFSLGFSVSYDQIIAFQRSAMDDTCSDGLPGGLIKQSDGGGFCQWVADNFDHRS